MLLQLLQLLGLLLQLLELELELHRSGLLHNRLLGGRVLCLVRVVQLRVRGLRGSEALWWCCRRRLLRGLKLQVGLLLCCWRRSLRAGLHPEEHRNWLRASRLALVARLGSMFDEGAYRSGRR